MTSDILGVSISGLRVSQNALRTVGHNIANANTPGYSRQATEISSVGGIQTGAGFIGSGSYTSNIERVVNDFVTAQVRQDTTLHSELNIYNQNISQLNDLLANESTGLSQGIQSFFSAVQTASDSPTSLSNRQLVVSQANNLAERFNTLSTRIEAVEEGVVQGIKAAVSNVNNLTGEIALLNNKIATFPGGQSGSPNDLLDQRDNALLELSSLISVSVSTQGDSQINVTVGNGIPLVLGSQQTDIAVGQNAFNPKKPEIVLVNSNITQSITQAFSGGEVGGLLNFQETVIDPTYNEIGRMATSIADNFNQLQTQGITLDNTYGSNIFTDINHVSIVGERVLANVNNGSGNPAIVVNINDSGQLTNSDYRLTIDDNAGVYQITRLSDDSKITSNIIPSTFPATISFDGIDVVINSGGFSAGDQFLIQPNRTAAKNLSSTGLQAADIALAFPFETQSHLGNLGTASISAGDMLGIQDANGQPLSMFSQAGQMSPPLIVKFTSPTTYDILDNSDPGHPVALTPPMRNQTYVPGSQNALFSADSGATLVTSAGANIGLPGSSPATQAALKPSVTPPAFAAVDFSTTSNQFSFDVVVSNTLAGANDGTFLVTIETASITNNTELLAALNNDLSLSGSDVRAYITDTAQGEALAFASPGHGAGDIVIQNYNADPDSTLDNAPAGQANTLLGFDVEGTVFTTVSGVNGISGIGSATNNYPVETLTIVTTNPTTGSTSSQNIFTSADASARTTASQLSNLTGVNASAFNVMELRGSALTLTEPLQLSLNGENLINYDTALIASSVPSPALNNGEDFNDYLADEINNNTHLQASGITAISAYDAVSGEFFVKINSTLGDDFMVELTAAASGGGSFFVNDGSNDAVELTGSGTNTSSQVVIGGRIDVSLSDNVRLSTNPETSLLFGDSRATNFSQTAYMGIQASISGSPETGDYFTLNFNANAKSDNRNGIAMSGLQQAETIGGNTQNTQQSFQQNYNTLIESIGISANSSQNNTEAAANVLEQTTSLRNSISGVNLDEEAANLIRYEQLYSANAQVITVARELFDRLINSF
jgi:flagellar hook-associated protein 1 FlgK